MNNFNGIPMITSTYIDLKKLLKSMKTPLLYFLLEILLLLLLHLYEDIKILHVVIQIAITAMLMWVIFSILFFITSTSYLPSFTYIFKNPQVSFVTNFVGGIDASIFNNESRKDEDNVIFGEEEEAPTPHTDDEDDIIGEEEEAPTPRTDDEDDSTGENEISSHQNEEDEVDNLNNDIDEEDSLCCFNFHRRQSLFLIKNLVCYIKQISLR